MELGVGDGSILKSVSRRWKDAIYTGFEIDLDLVEKIKKDNNKCNIYQKDCSVLNLDADFMTRKEFFDVCVCNPPFHSVINNSTIKNLIEEMELRYLLDVKRLGLDLVFLLQNLLFLRRGGELGIIIPDGVATNITFRKVREYLVSNYNLVKLIELPTNGFKNTDAQTHILILSKVKDRSPKVELLKSNIRGEIVGEIVVDIDRLIERMDYSFHFWKSGHTGNKLVRTLGELDVTITRGKHSKKKLSLMQLPFVHTSDIPDTNLFIIESNRYQTSLSQVPDEKSLAEKGDILITRVGKRCVGRSAMLGIDRAIISDCLIKIRVNSPLERELLFQALNSENGKAWINAHIHGTCARLISMRDLYSFPLT
ncbi:MAG: hypothetical protein Roseis3KO_40360 [Roseivirga sp.]